MSKRVFAIGDRVRFTADCEQPHPTAAPGTVRTIGRKPFIVGMPAVDAYQVTWDNTSADDEPDSDHSAWFHWMSLLHDTSGYPKLEHVIERDADGTTRKLDTHLHQR